MSFILDALKKSEQERPNHAVPDLNTQHGIPSGKSKRRRLWPGVLVLALFLNAGLLLWWLRPWIRPEQVPSPIAPVASPAAEVAASPLPETFSPAPPMEEKRIAAQRAASTAAVRKNALPAVEPQHSVARTAALAAHHEEKKEAPEVPRPATREEIPEISGLPSDVRRSIPPFDISLHFYTEASSSRMVRINGRNLREGQNVVEGLALEKITASGVVLNWRGHRFRTGNFD